MALEQTIQLLAEEAIIPANRVLVLNTVPLTRDRFNAQKGFFSLFRHKSDFLQTQFPSTIDWATYRTILVEPILAELMEIKETTAATIDYDVTVADFSKALWSEQYSVIFLLAHHLSKRDAVEFADKDLPLPVLKKMVVDPTLPYKKNLNLFVCEGEDFEQWKLGDPSAFGPMAFAFWHLPVKASYQFMRHWIRQLNGTTSLSTAYHQSIKTYLHDIDQQNN